MGAGTDAQQTVLDPITSMWFAEYSFRRRFGGGVTHWEYLNEPKTAVRWLLEIDRVVRRVKAREKARREAAARG